MTVPDRWRVFGTDYNGEPFDWLVDTPEEAERDVARMARKGGSAATERLVYNFSAAGWRSAARQNSGPTYGDKAN